MWIKNTMDYCCSTNTANEDGVVAEKRSLKSVISETNYVLTEALKIMHEIEREMIGCEETLPTINTEPDRCFENEIMSNSEMAVELLRKISNLNCSLFGKE